MAMKCSPLSRALWFRSGIVTALGLLGLVSAADDVTSASGVNIHFTDPQSGELEMMKAAGFKWVRMDFFWGAMEKERGVYDFAAYDRLVAALTKQGIRAYF
ncbi:MAG: Glutamate synthase large chain, partial [Akkermansiaceae bacterium]|nr:Glutamate synthase large chain [Akkermansiaceae bacterium]